MFRRCHLSDGGTQQQQCAPAYLQPDGVVLVHHAYVLGMLPVSVATCHGDGAVYGSVRHLYVSYLSGQVVNGMDILCLYVYRYM